MDGMQGNTRDARKQSMETRMTHDKRHQTRRKHEHNERRPKPEQTRGEIVMRY